MLITNDLFKHTEIIKINQDKNNKIINDIISHFKNIKNNEVNFYKSLNYDNLLIISGYSGSGKTFGIQTFLQNNHGPILYATPYKQKNYFIPDIKIIEKNNKIKITKNIKDNNKMKFVIVDDLYFFKNKKFLFYTINYFIDKNTIIVFLVQSIKDIQNI